MILPLQIGKYYKDGWGNVLFLHEGGSYCRYPFDEFITGVVSRVGPGESDDEIGDDWRYRKATGYFCGQEHILAGNNSHLSEGPFDTLEDALTPPLVFAWVRPTTAQRALILD